MKNSILFAILTFSLVCCSHSDNKVQFVNPISQLPPATQTGANTFGCLVDGKILKPGYYNNSFQCFYQFVDDGYYFYVTANNTERTTHTGVAIGTERLPISEGLTLNLFERNNGNAFGGLSYGDDITGVFRNDYTSSSNTGELNITKLDFTHQIVSGTFWFDIKDNQGVVHQIRNGRFDMIFSR